MMKKMPAVYHGERSGVHGASQDADDGFWLAAGSGHDMAMSHGDAFRRSSLSKESGHSREQRHR
jgi:hypothetical protein